MLLSLLKIELIQKEIICETEDTEVKGKLGKEYCVGEYDESNSWCVRVVILWICPIIFVLAVIKVGVLLENKNEGKYYYNING